MTRAEFVMLLRECKTLSDNGQPIQAIRLLREKTGCGLIDAKHAVDRLYCIKMEAIR